MFINKLCDKLITKLGVFLHFNNSVVARTTLPKFGNKPQKLTIELPRRIINPQHMFLGDNINIGPGSFLIAIKKYPGSYAIRPGKEQFIQRFTPRITIGNGVSATGNLQIAAHNNITIEDDVLFASNVNITDGFHGYENANEPYKYQQISKIAQILIKKGCWIGQNAVIMPGTTIGEYSIIGANSVVTTDIPDRCIAVGAPAKAIKKWDNNDKKWIQVMK